MGLEIFLLFGLTRAQMDLRIFNCRGATLLIYFQAHTLKSGTTAWLCGKSHTHRYMKKIKNSTFFQAVDIFCPRPHRSPRSPQSDPLSLRARKNSVSPPKIHLWAVQNRCLLWNLTRLINPLQFCLWWMAQGMLLGKSMKQAEAWSYTFSIWISSIALSSQSLVSLFPSFQQSSVDRLSGTHQELLAFVLLAYRIISGLRKNPANKHRVATEHFENPHWISLPICLHGSWERRRFPAVITG